MEPYTRIKVIGGREYAYEITPYYDPETKNTKHKSKYLGVYKDGKIKRKRTKLPVEAYEYGEFLPLLKIIDEMGIDSILYEELDRRRTDTILALAMNRVINPVSACNVKTWYEKTVLCKMFGDLPLTSQSLSDFLGALGESSIPSDFSKRLIEKVGQGQPLLYDITSLSSNSKLMDMLEWGHNRDGDGLPQLNLSIIANKDLGIPITFDVYPGSIVDVSTLKNTTTRLTALGIHRPTMVMDRGFFSESNINELFEADFNFVLPASFSNSKVRSIIQQSRKDIEKPAYLKKYNGSILFVKPVVMEIGGRSVDGFVFYDLKREKEEKTKFYQRLHDVKYKLERRKLKKYERPSIVYADITKDLSKYYRYKVRDDRFVEVEMKQKTMARRANRFGFTVILHRGRFTWSEAISWSKERDIVEKMFRQLKNDLEAKPVRAHKTEVARGWIFVGFIALILRCRLSKLLIETGLVKDYSIPSLILTLSRLKQIEMSDGSLFITELTKKHKEIYKALNIEP